VQTVEVNDSVPIIAMSALQPGELARYYKDAGLTTYVSKPFDMVEFVEMVSAYV
jgi:DNA-binding response OmpR family regulator